MDLFKRPVVMIIVAVAIIIAITWSYISKVISNNKAAQQANDQTMVSLIDLTNIDAKEFDELVKTEYATALAKALEANAKNQLSAIEVVLPSLELKAGEVRYIFSSASDSRNNWTISFSRDTENFLRAEIPKEDYMGILGPINTALWKFNYVTALQIAEKNGGKDWRDQNGLGNANILLKQFPNDLEWMVTYRSGEASKIINIDAATGKVI